MNKEITQNEKSDCKYFCNLEETIEDRYKVYDYFGNDKNTNLCVDLVIILECDPVLGWQWRISNEEIQLFSMYFPDRKTAEKSLKNLVLDISGQGSSICLDE